MQYMALKNVLPEMVLAERLQSPDGQMSLGEGTVLTAFWLQKLAEWGIERVGIEEAPRETSPVEGLGDLLQQLLKPEAKTMPEQIFTKECNYIEGKLYSIFLRTRCTGSVTLPELAELAGRLHTALQRDSSALRCLHLPERAENYLYRHAIDVASFSGLLGRWLGLPDKKVAELVYAGLLHDIGKARVEFAILSKPGPLGAAEHQLARLHVERAAAMLQGAPHLSEAVAAAVREHHERLDGSGYPEGLKGGHISAYGRILTIADVYDALISDRYYKRGISPFAAARVMQNQLAGQFDLAYLQVFLSNVLGVMQGEQVLLTDGRQGRIAVSPAAPADAPLIMLDNGLALDLNKQAEVEIAAVYFN